MVCSEFGMMVGGLFQLRVMYSGLSLGFLYGFNDSEFRKIVLFRKFIKILQLFSICCLYLLSLC